MLQKAPAEGSRPTSPLSIDPNASMVGSTYYTDAYNAALEGRPSTGNTPTHQYGYEQGLAERSRRQAISAIS